MALCRIGVIVVRQVRCQVNPSTHVQVEAFARVAKKVVRNRRGAYTNELSRISPDLSASIEATNSSAASKRLTDAYHDRLDALIKLLSDSGFKPDEVAEARGSANFLWFVKGSKKAG